MHPARRRTRSFALAVTAAAIAAAPSTALARPAIDPGALKGSQRGGHAVHTESVPAPVVVRQVTQGGDTTLPIVLSGAALLVAFAGAGVAGQTRRRSGRLVHS
jgi:hypothetical protein